MSNQSRWLKPVPPPQSANVSQSDVARIAREKREREQQQQQAIDESQSATMDFIPSAESEPLRLSYRLRISHPCETNQPAGTKRTGCETEGLRCCQLIRRIYERPTK
jgi:hypothetical protein